MIGTPTSLERPNIPDENYESNRIESHKAEGLRFVPEDTGQKVYCVVCKDASDWNEIHDYIINENEIDGIPNRKIDCSDECKTSDRMASYVISDAEAEQLKNHPKVFGVNLDPSYYSGTFKGLTDRVFIVRDRYASDVKCQYDHDTTFLPSSPGSDLLSRTDAAIYRHQQKDNPWKSLSDTTIIEDSPQYNGDGTGVDLVVCDESAWYGHIEFIKTGVGEPTNFVGENVLKSGFATSATTGVCGVLDMVLDAPYYLDPDFFEADVSNRLITRWDGTKVPVESVARNWWRINSTSYRSAKYVSSSNGGSATGNADFGNIWVNTLQTRARQNGANTAEHTGGGYHGTPCMCLAYGKTHGWAYNANKWHMNIIWGTGAQSISNCFKILKIFHQNKPDNPILGTKDPTLTSHSWGSTGHLTSKDGSSTGYHYFRKDGTGTGSNAGTSFNNSSKPAWLNNFNSSSQYSAHQAQSYSDMTIAKDTIDAGVILFSAAGNDNQKQVFDGHPDYDNYETHVSSSTTLATALTDINRWWSGSSWVSNIGRTAMINRPGFPSQAGMYTDGNGKDVYPSFNIGVINSDIYNGMEYKASYSNMGEGIDCWALGAQVLAGCDSNSYTRKNRYDAYYRIDSNYDIVTSGGTQSYESEDREFGGTSCACPVACGLVATVLQHHRDWTWVDIKNWLKTEVLNPTLATSPSVTSGAFWSQYAEATTATDSKWNSDFNVHDDSKRKIIYMQRSGGLNISGLLNIKDGQLTIK